MHSQEILERAREGDPRVIAAILNHVLKPLGIRTQAARREEMLHVVLEANPLPEPQRLTAIVQKLLQDLHIQSIEQIVLYGQRSGEGAIAWRQDILLMAEAPESSMMNNQPYPPESHSDDSLPLILEASETSAVSVEPEPSSFAQTALEDSIFTFADIDAPLFVTPDAETPNAFPNGMEEVLASTSEPEASPPLDSEDLLAIAAEEHESSPLDEGEVGSDEASEVVAFLAIAPGAAELDAPSLEAEEMLSLEWEETPELEENRSLSEDVEAAAFLTADEESAPPSQGVEEALFSDEFEGSDSFLEALEEPLIPGDAGEDPSSPTDIGESMASFEAIDESFLAMEETASAELDSLFEEREESLFATDMGEPAFSPTEARESVASFEAIDESLFVMEETPSAEADSSFEEIDESLFAVDTGAASDEEEAIVSLDESLFEIEETPSAEADSTIEEINEFLFGVDTEEEAASASEGEAIAPLSNLDESLFEMEETPSAEADSTIEEIDEFLFAVDTGAASEAEGEAIAPLSNLDESLFEMEETPSAEADSTIEEIDEFLFAVDTEEGAASEAEGEAITPLTDLDEFLFSTEEDLSSATADLDESRFSTEEDLSDRSTDPDEALFSSEEDPGSSSTDSDEPLFDLAEYPMSSLPESEASLDFAKGAEVDRPVAAVEATEASLFSGEDTEDAPFSFAELEDPIAPIPEPEEAISLGLDNLDNNDAEGVLESSLEAVNASTVVPAPPTMPSPSSEDTLLTESLEPPVSLRESEAVEDTDEALRAFIKALQRPEAVILLFALVLATLWELYLDLAEGDTEESLTGTGLAKRLQVSPSTVSRRKDQEDFSGWSQSLDPEGIAWIYRAGRFWPLEGSIIAS